MLHHCWGSDDHSRWSQSEQPNVRRGGYWSLCRDLQQRNIAHLHCCHSFSVGIFRCKSSFRFFFEYLFFLTQFFDTNFFCSFILLFVFTFFLIFFTQYFQADGRHLINVMKDGKSSTSQINPASLFFPKPEISQMSGGDMTTKGGQTLQVTGSSFGPISSTIVVTLGGLPCTGVIWKSDSLLELVTPPMTGDGRSKNMVVEVTAGSQTNDVPFAFSYTAPTITSIDLLAQVLTTATDSGIRMRIFGTGMSREKNSVPFFFLHPSSCFLLPFLMAHTIFLLFLISSMSCHTSFFFRICSCDTN